MAPNPTHFSLQIPCRIGPLFQKFAQLLTEQPFTKYTTYGTLKIVTAVSIRLSLQQKFNSVTNQHEFKFCTVTTYLKKTLYEHVMSMV